MFFKNSTISTCLAAIRIESFVSSGISLLRSSSQAASVNLKCPDVGSVGHSIGYPVIRRPPSRCKTTYRGGRAANAPYHSEGKGVLDVSPRRLACRKKTSFFMKKESRKPSASASTAEAISSAEESHVPSRTNWPANNSNGSATATSARWRSPARWRRRQNYCCSTNPPPE